MTTFVQMSSELKEDLAKEGQDHVDAYGFRIGVLTRPLCGDVVEVKWLPSNITFAYQTKDVETVKPDHDGHIREPFKTDEFDGFVCRACDQWFDRGNYCAGTINEVE